MIERRVFEAPLKRRLPYARMVLPLVALAIAALIVVQWASNSASRSTRPLASAFLDPGASAALAASRGVEEDELPDLVVQVRAVGKSQVVIRDEVLDPADLERHAHRDADRADGQEFHRALNPHATAGTEPLERGEADHFRAVERHLPRSALRRVDHELPNRLAEQFADGQPIQLVCDVEGVKVDDFAGEPVHACERRRCGRRRGRALRERLGMVQ
jgi:hypothetical protein